MLGLFRWRVCLHRTTQHGKLLACDGIVTHDPSVWTDRDSFCLLDIAECCHWTVNQGICLIRNYSHATATVWIGGVRCNCFGL